MAFRIFIRRMTTTPHTYNPASIEKKWQNSWNSATVDGFLDII